MTPQDIISQFSGDINGRGISADALDELGYDVEAFAIRNGIWEREKLYGDGDGDGKC